MSTDSPRSRSKAKLSATLNPNFAASTVGNTFTVPGGKRLVVEFVTVNITIPIGQAAQFARLDTTASSFNQYLALTQREVMLQTNLFL